MTQSRARNVPPTTTTSTSGLRHNPARTHDPCLDARPPPGHTNPAWTRDHHLDAGHPPGRTTPAWTNDPAWTHDTHLDMGYTFRPPVPSASHGAKAPSKNVSDQPKPMLHEPSAQNASLTAAHQTVAEKRLWFGDGELETGPC